MSGLELQLWCVLALFTAGGAYSASCALAACRPGACLPLALICTVVAIIQLLVSLLVGDLIRLGPAPSHTWRTLLAQWAHFQGPLLIHWWIYPRYKRALLNPKKTQEETLCVIIKSAAGTAYGQDYKLAEIKCAKDLVAKHPLTQYSHYEKYAERAARGEKNVMSATDPRIIALSSGTTGKNKKYPVHFDFMWRYVEAGAVAICTTLKPQIDSVGLKRVFQLRLFHPPTINAHGLTEGGVGNVVARPHKYNVVPPCYLELHNEAPSFYVQGIFAVAERDIGHLDGFSSDLWYAFFKFLIHNAHAICISIATGEVGDFPGLPEKMQTELSEALKSDAVRAEEVADALRGPARGLALRLWPKVEYMCCCKSGSFTHSARLLDETYTHGIRQTFIVHGATEGAFGTTITEEPTSEVLTLAIKCTFFEFICEEDMSEENPKTLLIDQLEVGQAYEMVVTTSCGLYRNRFGDVIRVVGFKWNTPKYVFLYRSGQILNIAFDRTPEKIFYEALHQTAATWTGVDIINYTTVESMHLEKIAGELANPACYVAFVEAQQMGESTTILTEMHAQQLDECLSECNEAYQEFRDIGSISQLQLISVKSGTFEQLRNYLTCGKPSHQFKSPRVVRNEEVLQLLWQQRLSAVDMTS